MPNGTYGRAVPRLALAVAEYRARFGAWPTHAHGHGVMVIINEPGPGSDADDFVEYRPHLAERVRSQLICDADGAWIEVSGSEGRCAYGDGPGVDTPEFDEARHWLYGEPSRLRRALSEVWAPDPAERRHAESGSRARADQASAPPNTTTNVPAGDVLLRSLESRFVRSPIAENVWVPTDEGSLAQLATPEELVESLELTDDEVVEAIAPGTELSTLFDWEWSGLAAGGCWVEIARLGDCEYLQLNDDGGLVSEKVFAAIAAGSDEALNEVFARLLSTNGAAFDAELMGMLPDILTNHGPDRLRREVVYEAQLACFRRLDDTAEELQERIGYWWERVERLERRGTGGIVLEPATDSDPSAPHIIGADYEEATFAEYFELAYSESRF